MFWEGVKRGQFQEDEYERFVAYELWPENEVAYEAFLFVYDQVLSLGGGIRQAPNFTVLPLVAELFLLDEYELIRLARGWRAWLEVHNEQFMRQNSGKGSGATIN